ncbi:prepilin-type N-terminal cleavage/methylation domain-containing protein [Sorangium sp. So ce1036]|uniref:pilus assembly FimT family protein n=1 Tax=Sorangium sp. So ce1036 TaxID=3133328 RepID=UPI003F0BF7A8
MARRRTRGLTLVEVLITVTVIAVISGSVILGMGAVTSARLKRSAALVAGAVRVAYAHANAQSKPVRLVFDFEERMIALEESTSALAIERNDRTGGAAAATDAERAAVEEAESILKGPRAPRPAFQPAKAYGFNPEEGRAGKELSSGVRFLQVETAHQDDPVAEGRAYLYFWPGGQTERAAIQLSLGAGGTDDSVMTVLVSPLTGKTELRRGKVSMPRPRDDAEASEREDTGF